MKAQLKEAAELRENKQPEQAIVILSRLLELHPDDPDVNYQMAWTCDSIGKESEAVPFYERALANGCAIP